MLAKELFCYPKTQIEATPLAATDAMGRVQKEFPIA